jgi:hypothetical protein
MAVARQKPIDEALQCLQEVSIECPHTASAISGRIKCRVCMPTSTNLYSDDIFRDTTRADPCVELSEKNLTVESINIDGVGYEYSRTNDDARDSIYDLAVYKWNDAIKSYTRLLENSNEFVIVYTKLSTSSL